MKNLFAKILFVSFFGVGMIQSCNKDISPLVEPEPPIDDFSYFDFKTTKDCKLNVNFSQSNFNSGYVPFKIYITNPLLPLDDGVELINPEVKCHFKGMTDGKGNFNGYINLPMYVTEVWFVSAKPGVPELLKIQLNGSDINVNDKSEKTKQTSYPYSGIKVSNLYALANWNDKGVPANLSARDVITSLFLDDINTTLPNSPLPVSHPEFFVSGISHKLELIAPCTLDVTFVHEGAGWLNVLGYYVYPTGNKPSKATIGSIRKQVVFPNTSYLGSGGGLSSGDKVRLKYWDGSSYSETFPAGVTVEWILYANGFNNSYKNITNGNFTHYSDKDLNAEANVNLRQHSILLNDITRSTLVLSFEDIKRDLSYCDQDFNDAIYSVKPNPYSAVNTTSMSNLDVFVDTDGDGVSDNIDEFPEDPNLTYSTSYPGIDLYATLSYEDLWPSQGDYDMNDLVLDYNMIHYFNKDNMIKKIGGSLNVRASGAKYKNGFGIEFNFPTSIVSSLSKTGTSLTSGIIINDANGFEIGQAKANIVFFDNVFKLFNQTSGVFINTDITKDKIEDKTLTYQIEFATAKDQSVVGTPPYNPYMIIDCGSGNRGKEVHLPSFKPTSKANVSLFSTLDDRTNPAQNRYYVNKSNMPFALLVPETFLYPIEKENISNSYLKFKPWSQSMGVQFLDWFNPGKNGYSDVYKLYVK